MKTSRCLAFAVAVLAVSSNLHAADPLTKLASIHDFAFGGVGFTGITSKGEVAFREVMERKTAAADFLALLDSGNPQAKCYALVGLRLLDPTAFGTQVKRFEKDKTKVSTMAGCMISEQLMLSVVANISAGRYDEQAKRKDVRR
ncbi:MAG: hypothetical protein K1X78_00350 [Verrucomicrobiaceae bacterium]|nr:hypothetical protein [Verrucomicrobiaceae bacterium]